MRFNKTDHGILTRRIFKFQVFRVFVESLGTIELTVDISSYYVTSF